MNELKTLWETAWKLLHRGQSDANHPYRTPVVSTVSSTRHPRSRTLVLRKAQQSTGQLWCYTDRRSDKAADIEVHPFMSWTFWDPRRRIQFSGSGPTTWLPQEECTARFRQLPKHSRKAYATVHQPGTPLERPGDGLPADWPKRTEGETDYAQQYFGVLVTELDYIDILQLIKTGHRRLRAIRTPGQDWQLSWVVP
ncbi:MAG: pyridoxamine 5'-phosphate oxidase family protein [Bacteroidota bacterium]